MEYNVIVGFILLGFVLMIKGLRDIRRWKRGRDLSVRIGAYVPDIKARLPADDLELPYFQRVVRPWIERNRQRIAKRMTPSKVHDELEMKLWRAGVKMSPETFFFYRILMTVVAAGLTVLLVVLDGKLSHTDRLLFPLVVAAVVFLFFGVRLNSKGKVRKELLERGLPEVFDLLSVSVEAGLAFDAALRKVIANMKGVPQEEFLRVLKDTQLGISRGDALAALAERTQSIVLKRFSGLIAQSDRTGSGIAPALKIQARDIKEYRAAVARQKAAVLPVKIIFPMVLFIFPALFVVILGPAVLELVKAFG